MRRLLLILALVVSAAAPAAAQVGPQNITVNGGAATFAMGVNPSATIDISGTWTGTLTFEGQANGTTWRTITVTNTADLTLVTTTTASGMFAIPNVGYTNIRVHATAAITGTAVVYERNGAAARLTLPASFSGTLAAVNGGTGHTSYAVGDLVAANTTSTLSSVADVAVGQVLVSGGVGVLPAFSTSPSVTSIRNADATNGQAITGLQALTELTTIAAAATTDTVIQMPAASVVLGVTVRVTTIVPTCTTFTVGDSGSATRFSTAAVSCAATSTDPGTKAGAYYNAGALSIRITPNMQPASNTGRVRVTIYYYTVTPATS